MTEVMETPVELAVSESRAPDKDNPYDLGRRAERQKGLVPPDALSQCVVTVVGVGAIGRQVALQLAAMGAPVLRLWDFDTVEAVNLAAQGFRESDLGRYKVHAVESSVLELNSSVEVEAEAETFIASGAERSRLDLEDSQKNVLFCCVDSITVRRWLWEQVRSEVDLFIDGRMSAEVIRVLSSDNPVLDQKYPATLFSQEEAYQGSCTAKSTIYCSNIAAGLMLTQFAHWLRGFPVVADQTLNLWSTEFVVSD